MSTLHQIVRYVEEGGVFVNVAGLAFYYLWDGEKEDLSGPLLETYRINSVPGILERTILLKASHLLDSSLYRFFGIRTTYFSPTVLPVRSIKDEFFSDLSSLGGTSDVKEFSSAYRSEKDETTLIPLLKTHHTIRVSEEETGVPPIDFDCYPIAAVGMGKGYLMLNGMNLEKARTHDFEKTVEAIKRIVKKLGSKGTL